MITGNVTIKELFIYCKNTLLAQYDEKEATSITSILFEDILGIGSAIIISEPENTISNESYVHINAALDKLKEGEPIQYVLGKCLFQGMEMKVTPDVLIPRPETEEMTDMIIKEIHSSCMNHPRILDIGTGSGCIAISLAKHFPNAQIHATDISDSALAIARCNAAVHNTKIEFHNIDILNPGSMGALGHFDIIVSNPPYVCASESAAMHRNVLDFEPHIALFTTDQDPLQFYIPIIEFAITNLADKGFVWLEINEKMGIKVHTLCQSRGFRNTSVIKDMNNKDRFVRFAG